MPLTKEKMVWTKTLLLKHYYRRQGNLHKGGVCAMHSRKSAKKRTKACTFSNQRNPHFPDPPILAFFVFLAFSVLRFSLLFCAFFPFFPKDFQGSAERKNPPPPKKSRDWRVREGGVYAMHSRKSAKKRTKARTFWNRRNPHFLCRLMLLIFGICGSTGQTEGQEQSEAKDVLKLRLPEALDQKTREGCGCFWDLLGGSRGKFREKSRENCWKNVPESRNALNSRISGTGKGKPAGNIGSTLPGPCPTFHAGCFLRSTVPAFSSFSD